MTLLRRLIYMNILALLAAPAASAAVIYVDNVNGSDGNDGLAPETQTVTTGPVRTLRRGTQLAQPGDTLFLRNTGTPYYEMLALSGGKHSGVSARPFRVEGNGSVLCGLRQIPKEGWNAAGPGLWQVSLTRKGYYRFFRDGVAWPEFHPPTASFSLDEIPEGHWTSRRGQVYFRVPLQQPPMESAWTYAAEDQGVSLVDVRQVVIVDLRVVGFRVDGINVDNACRHVTLERVASEHHGRAGLAVGGSSRVRLVNSRIVENGRYSVLVTEAAEVEIEASDLGGVAPTVAESAASPSFRASAAASTSDNFKPVVLK
jgi:hypothetical protein